MDDCELSCKVEFDKVVKPNEPSPLIAKPLLGRYSLEIEDLPQRANTIVETAPVKFSVPCSLDCCKSSLASIYLAQPEVPEDTWPPMSSLKYINLALIKQEKINYGSKYARITVRGDIDDIL